MTEFQKFVVHVRNLKAQGVQNVMLEVDYLNSVLEDVSPLPETLTRIKDENNAQYYGDGGAFSND